METVDIIFAVSAIAYLPGIFALKYYVDSLNKKDKKDLDYLLMSHNCAWNIFLSIFSACGAYYCINQFLTNGYNCSFLENPFWIDAFCLSKIPELMDTVFIVLRSKPLVLLQYWHHFATLIMCWIGMKIYPKEVLLGAFMNYAVHTMMYAYYAIYILGFKGIRKYGIFITFFQLLQMAVAIYVLFYNPIIPCKDTDVNVVYVYWFSIGMYSSYFVLFGQLFLSKM